MSQTVNTAREAIVVLGGNRKVAELLNTKERVVSNWRSRGLPPKTFRRFKELLGDKLPPPEKWAAIWPKMK